MKDIIKFEEFLLEEFGSGDVPSGCHKCGKKKKTKKGLKKMKWNSEIMAEGCGCGKKKKNKKNKKLIKDIL